MQAMKCIYRQNTYDMNSLSRSTLIGEYQDGKRSHLLASVDGYRATLTVTSDGFTLTNGTGEILRRGIESDIFSIYDGLLIDVEPLLVRDEIKGVEMSFHDYENKFGFDRVDRTVKSKHKLYAIQTKKETAIGIQHYQGLNTLWIASIYFPEPMNGTEISDYAARFIFEHLDANQTAIVNAVGIPKDMRHPYVKIYNHEDDKRYDMVRELAEDALGRKETISEVLDEPNHESEDKNNDDSTAV